MRIVIPMFLRKRRHCRSASSNTGSETTGVKNPETIGLRSSHSAVRSFLYFYCRTDTKSSTPINRRKKMASVSSIDYDFLLIFALLYLPLILETRLIAPTMCSVEAGSRVVGRVEQAQGASFFEVRPRNATGDF